MNTIAVTVAVITYNSSRFIIETLESIKSQTYQNIKLIVTDDCSSDNTLAMVNAWIEKNASRFVSAKVITSETNTGVTANFNRAFDACDTRWLKEIGGDDILLPNCIEDNVEYVSTHPDSIAVFSKAWSFKTRMGRKVSSYKKHFYDFFGYSDEEKYHHLFYVGNYLPVPTVFFNVDSLRELNIKHDERIPLFEDYPLWITFLRRGIRFDFFDKQTVWYRVHKGGLSSVLPSPVYFRSIMLFFLYYFLEEIKEDSDKDHVYGLISERATRYYSWTYREANKKTPDYIIGHIILLPFRWLKTITAKQVYWVKVFVWRLINPSNLQN